MHGRFGDGVGVDGVNGGRYGGSILGWLLDVVLVTLEDVVFWPRVVTFERMKGEICHW